MKKSLIAIAALTAAAGASAQVTLYGRANLVVDSYSATGSTGANPMPTDIAARTRVIDSGSRIGFRVNEDLGGGARAFAVCETGVNFDNGGAAGQSGAPNASANTFCSREGHLGYGNKSWETRIGRQNVFWTHGELNQTGANFLGADVQGAFQSPSSGMSFGAASRVDNTILFQVNQGMAGSFAGSHFYYSTTAGENKGTPFSTSTTAVGTNGTTAIATGSVMGVKLNFSQGPWVAMFDYAKQADSANNIALATNADRTSMKTGAGFKYAKQSLVSVTIWEHETVFSLAASKTATVTAVGPAAQAGDRKQSGWGLNLVHDLGAGLFAYGQYAKMGNAKGVTGVALVDTGATGLLIGVRKNLSARTGVYAAAMQINNDRNNAINFTGGAYAPGVSQLGADPKIFQVGMMHNF